MTNDSILTSFDQPTLIEVMAPHCGECRAMQPDLDTVASEYEDRVDFVILDATVETDQVASLRVLGTPTLIAVSSGQEVARFAGRRTHSELRELFGAVADNEAESISKVSGSDQFVWTVAGVLLGAVGFATGPSWFLVAIGLGLVGYASIARVGSGRK